MKPLKDIERLVMQAASRHLSTVTLELGGKSPVIVDETADPALAAERITWGKFINAGQTCVAPDYVLVHRSQRDLFVEAMKLSIQKLYGDNPEARFKSPDFNRIVDGVAFQRLKELLEKTVAQGAIIAIGGELDEHDCYIAPTVLTEVGPDSPAMIEEIFGPILPIIVYDHLETGLQQIRMRPKPLALYIFSRNSHTVETIIQNVPAGGTCINHVLLHLANHELPFGGVGESGQGNYHGHFGFKTFSHERAILRARRWNPSKYFYPPYAPQSKLIKGLKEHYYYETRSEH